MAVDHSSLHTTFVGIQALRFVAAMLVVYAHTTGMVGERILRLTGEHFWRPGMAGVDIFFVISGFVMAVSSRKLVGQDGAWKTFMKLRLVRIVPLYWLATVLKIALVLAVPAMALTTVLDAKLVLSSFFFIPVFNPDHSLMFPVVKVGWTLMYEMFFYLVFALALFLKRPALSTSAIIFAVLSIINFLTPREIELFHGFFGPLLLEFVMGMVIAELCQRGYKVNPAMGAVLVVAAFAVIVASGDLPISLRWVFWGLPAAVIVGVVALCEAQLRDRLPSLLRTLGDSSYSLYLFHTFAVPVLGALFVKMHLQNTMVAVVLCMLISPIVGWAVYRALELPLTRLIRNMVIRKSPVLADSNAQASGN